MHSYIHAPRILWMKDRHIDTIWWNHMVCKYNEPPQRIWNLPGAILLPLDLIFIKLKVQVSGGDQDSKNPFPSVYFEQKCYLVLRTKEIPFYMRWCVWKEQALRGITESLLPMPFRRWSALLLMFSCKQEMWLRMAKQWVRKAKRRRPIHADHSLSSSPSCRPRPTITTRVPYTWSPLQTLVPFGFRNRGWFHM
jgi:hypothetical protein